MSPTTTSSMRDVTICVRCQLRRSASVSPLIVASVPTGDSPYGCPVKATLSENEFSNASGSSPRWRTPLTIVLRTVSTSPESRRGCMMRSAKIAKVESKALTVLRTPTSVQSIDGAASMALPRRAIFRSSTSRGYFFVPRSDASSSSSSSPALFAGTCDTPPSRYRFAATTSLAVTRRWMTLRPFTSNDVVAESAVRCCAPSEKGSTSAATSAATTTRA